MKKESKTSYLHFTSSVTALDLTVPISLFATHLYSPLSVLLTFVIVNCLFCNDKVILGLAFVFTSVPSLVHEKVGAGFPLALQEKTVLFPSLTV